MKSKKSLSPFLDLSTTSFLFGTSNEKLPLFCLHYSCMSFNKVISPFPREWVTRRCSSVTMLSVIFDTKMVCVQIIRRQLLD